MAIILKNKIGRHILHDVENVELAFLSHPVVLL